jgi:ribosome-binding protein aMBF1 (putative translation factor)
VYQCFRNPISLWLLTLSLFICVGDVWAQKKSRKKTPAPAPVTELTKLRQEFVKATNEYKASLEKLVQFYEADVKRAEDKLAVSQKLLAEGLIAKAQVEENERALAEAKAKVADTRRQMTGADDQIAAALVEASADEQIAKNLKLAKQRLVRTSSFIRFAGGPGWHLGEAWKIQRFFSDTFRKELPIAVFGQGAIHDRWRLDHRNAMDISLHPDSPDGQGLLNFLQRNGIPYLAFRSAIPGTATGPHIHIGKPSHRY